MVMEKVKVVEVEGGERKLLGKVKGDEVVIMDEFGMVKVEGEIEDEFEEMIDEG